MRLFRPLRTGGVAKNLDVKNCDDKERCQSAGEAGNCVGRKGDCHKSMKRAPGKRMMGMKSMKRERIHHLTWIPMR